MPIGRLISIPWGLTIYIVILIVVLMIISEVWWVLMKRLPEDDQAWDENSRFILKSDEEWDGDQPKAPPEE